MSQPRPGRDPEHEPLREVRRGLLRLHKALIDAERAVFEAERGAMSNAAFLQALMEEPAFQWLRPYSGLIVEIDEGLADRQRPVTRAQAHELVERVGSLVAPGMLGVFTANRLEELRRQDVGVQFILGELNRSIAAALGRYRD